MVHLAEHVVVVGVAVVVADRSRVAARADWVSLSSFHPPDRR